MLPQPAVRKLANGKFRNIFLKRHEKRTAEEKGHTEQVKKDNEAFTKLERIKERMITFFDAPDKSETVEIFDEIEARAKESVFPPIKNFCA